MSVRTLILGFSAMGVILFAPDGPWWLFAHAASGYVMGRIIAKAAAFDAREAK